MGQRPNWWIIAGVVCLLAVAYIAVGNWIMGAP
jgi:hypothetical protein